MIRSWEVTNEQIEKIEKLLRQDKEEEFLKTMKAVPLLSIDDIQGCEVHDKGLTNHYMVIETKALGIIWREKANKHGQ